MADEDERILIMIQSVHLKAPQAKAAYEQPTLPREAHPGQVSRQPALASEKVRLLFSQASPQSFPWLASSPSAAAPPIPPQDSQPSVFEIASRGGLCSFKMANVRADNCIAFNVISHPAANKIDLLPTARRPGRLLVRKRTTTMVYNGSRWLRTKDKGKWRVLLLLFSK